MPISFPVAPGSILFCDYTTGFRAPEMVKRRPVVVISPRLPHREQLCTVVPLSTTPPSRVVDYQCGLTLASPLPAPFGVVRCWAKADMLATVALNRLDLFRTARDPITSRRRFLHPKVTPEQ